MTAFIPQLLTVYLDRILEPGLFSGKIPPANTSCTTSRNGMIVMAVVVVCAMQDTISASISAA